MGPRHPDDLLGPPPERPPQPMNVGAVGWSPAGWDHDRPWRRHPVPLLAEAKRQADQLVSQIINEVTAAVGPRTIAAHILHSPEAGCGLCDAYRAELARRGLAHLDPDADPTREGGQDAAVE